MREICTEIAHCHCLSIKLVNSSRALLKSRSMPFCLIQDLLSPTLLKGVWNTERLSVSPGIPSTLRARWWEPILGNQPHDQRNDQSLNSVTHSPSTYLLMTYNVSTTVQDSEGETKEVKRCPLPSRGYSLDRDIMSTLALVVASPPSTVLSTE